MGIFSGILSFPHNTITNMSNVINKIRTNKWYLTYIPKNKTKQNKQQQQLLDVGVRMVIIKTKSRYLQQVQQLLFSLLYTRCPSPSIIEIRFDEVSCKYAFVHFAVKAHCMYKPIWWSCVECSFGLICMTSTSPCMWIEYSTLWMALVNTCSTL